MKRRRSILKSPKTSVPEFVDAAVKKDTGKFTFQNGDAYEGEYEANTEEFLLVKQGTGKYITDDFNMYDGKWNNDTIADTDIQIRYNNGAQYRGAIDASGAMGGLGTYIFPDGSSIKAIWLENKPHADIVYVEPRGFEWSVVEISEDAISFTSGNHFWREMCEGSDEGVAQSTDSVDENGLN